MQRLLFLLLSFGVLLAEGTASEVCDVDSDMPPCIVLSRGTGCGCVFSGTKARCCHFQLKLIGNYFDQCGVNATELSALFLFNCTNDDGQSVRTLDLSPLARMFPNLATLAVTGADYRTLNFDSGSGSKFSNLRCLNVSNNILDNSTAIAKVIDSIPSLKRIDISSNNISIVPNVTRESSIAMHIENNKHLKCDGIDSIMAVNITQFENAGQTECLKNVNITQWENNNQLKMNLSSIQSTNLISIHCPMHCLCEKIRIVQGSVLVMVNCSGVGLERLPEKLPMQTTTLDVSMNKITDLSALRANESYQYLTSLYADNNSISELNVLEGSRFLEMYNTFSIQRNLISKIPHFMGKVENKGGGKMRFSGNKFNCNCDMETNFRAFMIQFMTRIDDINYIMCDNHPSKKIITLGIGEVCVTSEDVNYIYYVIIAEALLLILLVAKVSYDYWVFKNAGYLPWPASKMPKLPCDCVLVK